MCANKEIANELKNISYSIERLTKDIEYQKKDIQELKISNKEINERVGDIKSIYDNKITTIDTRYSISLKIQKYIIFIIAYFLFVY